MTTAEAIDKIKKLLRMKHGGTPEEVAACIRLAEKIAAEAGIDLGSVNADLDADRYAVHHNGIGEWGRVPMELHLACRLCEEVFDVDFVLEQTAWVRHRSRDTRRLRLNVVGHELDRAIAGYCAIYVARQMRLAWRHKRGRCRDRESFMLGFQNAIKKKLAVIRPAREIAEALILSRRDYIAKNWPDSKSNGRFNLESMKAAMAGYAAAEDVDVHRPVAAGRDPRKQLAPQALQLTS